MKKIIKKVLIIIGIVLLVLFIAAVILPSILKFNPDLLSGHKGNFTKADLDRICGVELRQDEREMGNISCMKYWNNRNVPTEFDDMQFYVFKNSRQAKKAFNNIKKNYFSKIIDEGKDFVKGDEADVFDADIVAYFYIHNNLIIEVHTEVYSEWPYNPDDPSTYQEPYIIDQEYLDSLIRNNF